MLDASKAFDRIRFDKLFSVLLERDFPAPYRRFLLNGYLAQTIRVKWGSSTSKSFKGTNGVRQGGVISPILFTIYMERLIDKLKNSNYGCCLGSKYLGCVMYSDDLSLLSPSLTGLQQMVNICNDFGLENSIMFNEKKSVCIEFNNCGRKSGEDIVLNGTTMKWEQKVKHVGNIINCRTNDEDDIRFKKQNFFVQVNKLIVDYEGVSCNILSELFSRYCSSFYGSQMWDLRCKEIQGLYRAWNKAVRRLLGLPFNTHCYLLPLILNTPSLEVQLTRRYIKFFRSMYFNKNQTVSYVCKVGMRRNYSVIARNLFFICNKFGCSTAQLLQRHSIKDNFTPIQIANAQGLADMLYARDRVTLVEGFQYEQLQDMINYFATM